MVYLKLRRLTKENFGQLVYLNPRALVTAVGYRVMIFLEADCLFLRLFGARVDVRSNGSPFCYVQELCLFPHTLQDLVGVKCCGQSEGLTAVGLRKFLIYELPKKAFRLG